MSGERVGFRFKHADAVVKRNPQGRSRRGWVMEPVEQTTSRGTKMPATESVGGIVNVPRSCCSTC
jgi:hypothetical protein